MTYVDPESVISPQGRWELIDVLRNGAEDGKGDDDAALAIGKMDGRLVLAIRWNGTDKPEGNDSYPRSYGYPVWFALPGWMNHAFTDGDIVPKAKQALVKALFDLDKERFILEKSLKLYEENPVGAGYVQDETHPAL